MDTLEKQTSKQLCVDSATDPFIHDPFLLPPLPAAAVSAAGAWLRGEGAGGLPPTPQQLPRLPLRRLPWVREDFVKT